MFKGSRHNNSCFFIISHYYYDLTKRTIRANGIIFHNLKPKNLRDVQNLFQDKTSMDMTPNKLVYLTSTCWDEKCQLLTFDMTNDKYTV